WGSVLPSDARSERGELRYRVPVSAGPPSSEAPFDQGQSEPGAALAVRIDDVRLPPHPVHALRTPDRRIEGLPVLWGGGFLQSGDDQVTRGGLGFVRERIRPEDRAPGPARTEEEVGAELQVTATRFSSCRSNAVGSAALLRK